MDNNYTISELPEKVPEKKHREDFQNLTAEECIAEIKNILSKCKKPKQDENDVLQRKSVQENGERFCKQQEETNDDN